MRDRGSVSDPDGDAGMRRADVRARVASEGGDVVTSTPAEYAVVMQREEAKWSALINRLNLKVD